MFKALFLAVSLASAAQPAVAQSIFDGFGEPQDPATAEQRSWCRAVARQIKDHTPRLNLGHGSVTVNFCVNSAGRIVKANLGEYSNNSLALIASSIISSLELPPMPRAARAKLRGECAWLHQSFYSH